MGGVSANPPIEAERGGGPFLLYRDGDDREQVFSFQPGSAQASVGRERPSDLVLGWDGQVSRLHARFERVDDGWTVVDDGMSRNGTFVNGERVSGRRPLNDGDTLRFGATEMTFRSPPVEAPAPQAEAPPPVAAQAPPAIAGDPAPAPEPGVDLSTSQHRVLVALCRPYKSGGFATPPSDQQIADELFLSVRAVKTHLAVLFAKLGVDELPEDQRRVGLVERAFQSGVISERDL
jgi:predicted component of type VI protein secretion system